MKKLLLFVPLMMVSTLTGCVTSNGKEDKNTPIISIQEWLKDVDPFENELYFWIGVNTAKTRDYEGVIADFLRDDIYGSPKKIKDPDTGCLMIYQVTKECGPYKMASIYIHENSVDLAAYKTNRNSDPDLYVTHHYFASGAASMILKAYRRMEEIRTIRSAEYKAAGEVATTKNFYQQIEESTTNPYVVVDGIKKEDNNHSLLDDIKDLEVPNQKESHVSTSGSLLLSYYANENFVFNIYFYNTETYIAELKYKYDSELKYVDDYTYCYAVSASKADAIITKARMM